MVDGDALAKENAEAALKLVFGDRQDAYGHPYDDYTRTAALWSGYLGTEITAYDATIMMILMKLSRLKNKYKADSVTDAHGYLLCLDRIWGKMNAEE